MDLALIALGLLVFALFHHVLPSRSDETQLLVVQRPTQTPAPTAAPTSEYAPGAQSGDDAAPTDEPTAEPTPEPTAEPISWREKFADKFSQDGKAGFGEHSYQSADVSVSVKRVSQSNFVYYVADIYVADIECFRAGLANNSFGKGIRQSALEIAKANDAVVAISGDYYGMRERGVVIRNGRVFRTTSYGDVCALYYDGTMAAYTADEFDIDRAIEDGAYQAWSFGPSLLTKEGERISEFNVDVAPSNPRSAVGYYEPGHYCFVVVDGRQPGYSDGITLTGLSKLMYELGCKVAYNLDGGQTSCMVFAGKLASKPYNGGRDVSDILFIGEVSP